MSKRRKVESRPHGATVYAPAGPHIVEEAKGFPDARASLTQLLQGLTFVKVVSVTTINKHFHGEAIEVKLRDGREKPKLVFFDSFGRSKTPLEIGPLTLTQCAMGHDHSLSRPTSGELLIGSLVPNTRKSHLECVLRGWSSDAKPLWELLRMLQYGTKATESAVRPLLLQPAGTLLMGNQALREFRDIIYATARVVLWGNLRLLQVLAVQQSLGTLELKETPSPAELQAAKDLKIGGQAMEFIDKLTVKLSDSTLQDAFMEALHVREDYIKKVQSDYNPATYHSAYSAVYAPPPPIRMPCLEPAYDGATPDYCPTSPPYQSATSYQPTSPPSYQPTSPPSYQPTSPPSYQPTSPPSHQPTSPPATSPLVTSYQPTSPIT